MNSQPGVNFAVITVLINMRINQGWSWHRLGQNRQTMFDFSQFFPSYARIMLAINSHSRFGWKNVLVAKENLGKLICDRVQPLKFVFN
jgi:hypothetical protein